MLGDALFFVSTNTEPDGVSPGSKSPLATQGTEKMFSISQARGVLCCLSLFLRKPNSWQQPEWRDRVLHNLTKTNRIFKSWLVSWCF